MREAVAALPPDRRRVIELLDFQGRSRTEAARMVGMSVYRLKTVRNEAYRDLRYHPRVCELAIAHGCRVPERRQSMYDHRLG